MSEDNECEALIAFNSDDCDYHGHEDSRRKKSSTLKMRALCGVCCSLTMLIPALFSLSILITQSNEMDICNEDGTNYLIDLDVWLGVMGIVPICIRSLYIAFNAYYYCHVTSPTMERKIRRNYFEDNVGVIICNNCGVFLFYLIFGYVGLWMYYTQMPKACKTNVVGQAILIIAIVQLVLYNILFCCQYFLWSSLNSSVFI